MAKSFSAQVAAFGDKAKRRSLAVFRQSAQAVAFEANTPKGEGGKLPLDTGNLRGSQLGSTSGMPDSTSGQPVEIAVRFAQLGDTFWIGWTAEYALRMEYGFVGEDKLGRNYNQRGNGFARSAAQNWPVIVARTVEEVKARYP